VAVDAGNLNPDAVEVVAPNPLAVPPKVKPVNEKRPQDDNGKN
jgi:hypothetical protein